MSNFRFTLDDLLDFDDDKTEGLSSKTNDAVAREITKEYAGPLETTRASNNYADGLESTMNIADVLMGQVLFKDNETILGKNEYLMSSLLGGGLISEDSGGAGSLGIFDSLIPNDIRAYVNQKREELGVTQTGDPGPGGGVNSAIPGGYNTAQYTFYAEQLINHPNFRLQGGPGNKNQDFNRVLADLRDGLINPWLIAVLKILCDNFAIYVGNFDATRTSGHMKNSQHYKGNAVDIGDMGPKGSAWGASKDALSHDSALVQQVFSCLNSIHAPWRPSVVIGPAFPSFGNGGKIRIEGTSFSSDANHKGNNGHFHIDCNTRPAPNEIPPVPKQTSTNPSVR